MSILTIFKVMCNGPVPDKDGACPIDAVLDGTDNGLTPTIMRKRARQQGWGFVRGGKYYDICPTCMNVRNLLRSN